MAFSPMRAAAVTQSDQYFGKTGHAAVRSIAASRYAGLEQSRANAYR
jgi:hypothetical protein